jgi:hypothetical protein
VVLFATPLSMQMFLPSNIVAYSLNNLSTSDALYWMFSGCTEEIIPVLITRYYF